eukprot:3272580-Rhodomonas_salina.1
MCGTDLGHVGYAPRTGGPYGKPLRATLAPVYAIPVPDIAYYTLASYRTLRRTCCNYTVCQYRTSGTRYPSTGHCLVGAVIVRYPSTAHRLVS